MRPPSRSKWPYFGLYALALFFASTRVSAERMKSSLVQDGIANPPPTTCPAANRGIASTTFPWTHHPKCLDILVPFFDRRRPFLFETKTFCVYTNKHFNNGRGISLVVSPDVASGFILGSYDNALNGLNGEVGEESGIWHVKQTKDKGRGVFTRTDIAGMSAGQTIISKTPVLFVARKMLEVASDEQKYALLHPALENLPEETKKSAKNLAKSWGVPETLDILQTNSLEVKWPWVDGEVPVILTVTPEVAMINHACRPNAFWRFNDNTLVFEVVALKNLPPGEEITLSYGFQTRLHGSRIRSLQDNFNFTCRCATCTANSAAIEASNDRLTEINALKSVLSSAYEDTPNLLGLLPPLIRNLEQEDLLTELPIYEEKLAIAWSQFGIEDRTKYWAQRARDHWSTITGKLGVEARRCVRMHVAPKDDDSWATWRGEPWEGAVKAFPEAENKESEGKVQEKGKGKREKKGIRKETPSGAQADIKQDAAKE